MKKGVFLGLMCFVLLLSCKKDDRRELFSLTYPPPPISFEILPGLNTFDTHIYTISPIPTRFEESLTNSGYKKEDVVAIQSQAAFLSSVFQDINLDFVHRVSVFVFDPFAPEHKIEFFYMDPVPFRDKTVVQLFPGIADISDWVMQEFIGVEIRLDYRQTTPTFFEMDFQFELRVLGN